MNFDQITSERKNLFFGLNFSKISTKAFCEIIHPVVDELDAKSRVNRFSKTRQENLHLTLYFLGSELDSAVKESLLQETDWLISKLQKDLDRQIQKLQCSSKLICLPNPRKPRVLAVEPSPSDALVLESLHQEIAQVIEKLLGASSRNQLSSKRKFFPHITIARIRNLQSREVLKGFRLPALPVLCAPKIRLFETTWEHRKNQKRVVYQKLR